MSTAGSLHKWLKRLNIDTLFRFYKRFKKLFCIWTPSYEHCVLSLTTKVTEVMGKVSFTSLTGTFISQENHRISSDEGLEVRLKRKN